MKFISLKPAKLALIIVSLICLQSCSSAANKKSNDLKLSFLKGEYGYDRTFFSKNNIKTIELKAENSAAAILLVPAYQGRVMTSSAEGDKGDSFGWINYDLIESGAVSSQFNPYGGEERLWLGPEGGPFSVYFKKGAEQNFNSWIVPEELDTEPFEVTNQLSDRVNFRKDFQLTNASGTELKIGIERKVSLLNFSDIQQALNQAVDTSVSFVAYESENTLINMGDNDWTEKSGALSIWMLSMFNPSPEGVVFIPYKGGSESEAGKVVNDDYFGKVPDSRLIVKDGVLFFKTDGKFRSKIGISPQRALPFCGSYDPEKQVLTLLWYSTPEKPSVYVNSKWGEQDHLFVGDVVNSYNDGPVEDGSIMGPFYEIEEPSPAAFLSAGEKITHIQRIFHLTGSEEKLTLITEKLFNYSLAEIKAVFDK